MHTSSLETVTVMYCYHISGYLPNDHGQPLKKASVTTASIYIKIQGTTLILAINFNFALLTLTRV